MLEQTKAELKDTSYGILNVLDDLEEAQESNDKIMINVLNKIKVDFKSRFNYLVNKYEAEKILNKK